MPSWISTKGAMQLLGVGSTTIKRWADQGLFPYYKTAGGHRRYRRSAVERLAAGDSTLESESSSPEAAQWLQLLMQSDLSVVAEELRQLPAEGDWFVAADFLGEVIHLVGRSWADGECSVIEEHIASIKLGQAIGAVCLSLPVAEDSPSCLVATLNGETHALGALLAQLCLRSRGLNAQSLGTNVDPALLTGYLRDSDVRLLAISASSCQTDEVSLGRHARSIGDVCDKHGIELVLGGEGAWPDSLEHGHRCHSFAELRDVLDRTGLGVN